MSMIDGLILGMQLRRQQEDDAKKSAAFDEDRADLKRQRARMADEQAREDNLRQVTTEAAQPVQAQSAMLGANGGEDEEGNPLGPNPTTGWKSVNGQVVRDPAQVDAALQAANSPQGTTERVARARMGAGDITGALALRTSARQERVAQLQETKLTGDLAAEAKKKEMGTALAKGGWEGLPAVYDRYNDGKKVRVQRDEKGDGATIIAVDDQGQDIPGATKHYPSLAHAWMPLAARFEPEKWLGMAEKEAETNRQQGNADRDFKLREQEAERRALHEKHLLANDARRTAAAERAASEAAQQQPLMPEDTFDSKTAARIAEHQVNAEADDARASGKVWTGRQIAQRKEEITGELLREHTRRFVESAAVLALQQAQATPKAYAEQYGKALKRGLNPQRLAQMGFQQPGGAAPGAAPKTPAGQAMKAAENISGSVVLQDGRYVAAPPAGGAAPVLDQGRTPGASTVPAGVEDGNYFRARRAEMMARSEKIKTDPDIAAMRRQQSVVLRAGSAIAHASLQAKIDALIAQRYGN